VAPGGGAELTVRVPAAFLNRLGGGS
jgi:hypothetical protein